MASTMPVKKSTTGWKNALMPSAMDWKRSRNQRPISEKNSPTLAKKPVIVSQAERSAAGRSSANHRTIFAAVSPSQVPTSTTAFTSQASVLMSPPRASVTTVIAPPTTFPSTSPNVRQPLDALPAAPDERPIASMKLASARPSSWSASHTTCSAGPM